MFHSRFNPAEPLHCIIKFYISTLTTLYQSIKGRRKMQIRIVNSANRSAEWPNTIPFEFPSFSLLGQCVCFLSIIFWSAHRALLIADRSNIRQKHKAETILPIDIVEYIYMICFLMQSIILWCRTRSHANICIYIYYINQKFRRWVRWSRKTQPTRVSREILNWQHMLLLLLLLLYLSGGFGHMWEPENRFHRLHWK